MRTVQDHHRRPRLQLEHDQPARAISQFPVFLFVDLWTSDQRDVIGVGMKR